jgi:hypothetical protein
MGELAPGAEPTLNPIQPLLGFLDHESWSIFWQPGTPQILAQALSPAHPALPIPWIAFENLLPMARVVPALLFVITGILAGVRTDGQIEEPNRPSWWSRQLNDLEISFVQVGSVFLRRKGTIWRNVPS